MKKLLINNKYDFQVGDIILESYSYNERKHNSSYVYLITKIKHTSNHIADWVWPNDVILFGFRFAQDEALHTIIQLPFSKNFSDQTVKRVRGNVTSKFNFIKQKWETETN